MHSYIISIWGFLYIEIFVSFISNAWKLFKLCIKMLCWFEYFCVYSFNECLFIFIFYECCKCYGCYLYVSIQMNLKKGKKHEIMSSDWLLITKVYFVCWYWKIFISNKEFYLRGNLFLRAVSCIFLLEFIFV